MIVERYEDARLQSVSRIDITVTVPCPACGATADVDYVQSYSFERLRYSESFRCEACGERTEGDGGDPEPSVRDALVAAHGTWRTELREVGANRLRVFERLTSDLGFSRGEALLAMKRAPVDVFVGTLPEAERWRDVLVAAGAAASVGESDRR